MDELRHTKHCLRCGLDKPASDFYQSCRCRCKQCLLEVRHKWIAANPVSARVAIRSANKTYRQKKTGPYLTAQRRYTRKKYPLERTSERPYRPRHSMPQEEWADGKARQ